MSAAGGADERVPLATLFQAHEMPGDASVSRPLHPPPAHGLRCYFSTDPGFLFADWTLAGGTFGAPAKRTATYVYTLSFSAPSGFFFDPALAQGGKNGAKVSDGGTRLFCKVQVKTLPQ